MIRSLTKMLGFHIHATDGDLGRVDDFYFDDDTWTVRYLIIETGNWLTGRQVLISPISVERVEWNHRQIDVALTREQIKHSPNIDTAEPVSRRQEAEYYRYYGWPVYWTGGQLWGPWFAPGLADAASATITPPPQFAPPPPPSAADIDLETHLRSIREVAGYGLHASDGEFGRVIDYLLQVVNWSIQYLVVDVSREAGKKVVLRPTDVERVDWAERCIVTRLNSETVRHSPEFDLARIQETGPTDNSEPGGGR